LIKSLFSNVKQAFKKCQVDGQRLDLFIIDLQSAAPQKSNIFILPLKFPVDLIQRPATEIRLEIAAGEMVRQRGRGRVR
jgi:hypothetical protein